MSFTLTIEECYEILDLPQDAPFEQVKKAYRELAKVVHPDFNKEPNAHELMLMLNKAYKELTDYYVTNKKIKPPTYEDDKEMQYYINYAKKVAQTAKNMGVGSELAGSIQKTVPGILMIAKLLGIDLINNNDEKIKILNKGDIK